MSKVTVTRTPLPAKLAPFTGVNNATARLLKAISAFELSSLREGDFVYVESVIDYWKWLPASVLVDDTATEVTICAPTVVGVGPGRFVRMFIPSPEVMTQTEWHISSAGNNEATGLAGAPLLTTAERRRRMGVNCQWSQLIYHLRYLSDGYADIIEGQMPVVGTVIYLHGSVNNGEGASTIFSGVATTVDTLNTATNTPWAITSATIPVSWTASGTVNARCRLTSGANIKALSWVTLDQGGAAPNAKARFAEFLTPVASFNVSPFVAPGVASAGPANGDTFVIEALRVLARVQIDVEAAPANSPNASRVVFDSISTSIAGLSRAAIYTDGCAISTLRCSFSFINFHQCNLSTIGDDGGKNIVGGYLSSTSTNLNSNSATASSVLDRFTLQGAVKTLVFSGSGGIANSFCNWLITQIGIFDSNAPTLTFTAAGSNARFSSFVLYGTGNTAAIIGLLRNATPNITTNTFTQPIVTAAATQVLINVNPSRSACPAFDQTTQLYTAARNLTFANIQQTVALGGFDYSFVDPVTGAGFVKY